MKIRNGFVSNSSSASFVITWQLLNTSMTLNQFICNMFDVNYDNIHDRIKTEFSRGYVDPEDLAIFAIDHTKDLGNGFYETSDFTSMRNSMSDFDHKFLVFVATLLTEIPSVRIIKAEVDDQ